MSEKILLSKDEFEAKRFFVERIRDNEQRKEALEKFDKRYGIKPETESKGAKVATFDEVIGEEDKPEEKKPVWDNCVEYARLKCPTLPRGLTTGEAKRAIINSPIPTKGAVAIVETGTDYDHVAYVEDTFLDGTVELSEANWGKPDISFRRGTPEELKIVGYFRADGPVFA